MFFHYLVISYKDIWEVLYKTLCRTSSQTPMFFFLNSEGLPLFSPIIRVAAILKLRVFPFTGLPLGWRYHQGIYHKSGVASASEFFAWNISTKFNFVHLLFQADVNNLMVAYSTHEPRWQRSNKVKLGVFLLWHFQVIKSFLNPEQLWYYWQNKTKNKN